MRRTFRSLVHHRVCYKYDLSPLTEYTGPTLVAHVNELLPFIQPALGSQNPRIIIASARAFLSLLFDVREVRITLMYKQTCLYRSFNDFFYLQFSL